jgi:hypothetical protein
VKPRTSLPDSCCDAPLSGPTATPLGFYNGNADLRSEAIQGDSGGCHGFEVLVGGYFLVLLAVMALSLGLTELRVGDTGKEKGESTMMNDVRGFFAKMFCPALW